MIFGGKSGGGLTEKAVMERLKTVNDPELHKDLVSLGMVKDVRLGEDGRVGLTIELTTPACPLKDVIGRDIDEALKKLPDYSGVDIDFTANVAGRQIGGQDLAPGVRNIIAVASGKGGVGKSTVSVNLAISLSKTGAKVGLLDADIYGPNTPTMLGAKEAPRVQDNKMIPLECHGIKLISMGVLVPPDQPVVWRGPMLNNALRQFFGDVIWGDLDYLIVDLPPGTGDVQISLVQLVQVTGAVVVTTPQTVSVEDARRGLAMFHQTNTPVLGIIENMAGFQCPGCETVYPIFGEGGAEKVAAENDIPLIGRIPLAMPVREGGDSGKPITVSDPEAPISQIFLEAARNLAARVSVANLEEGDADKLEIKLGSR